MTKQGVGALPLYALTTKDMLNFSISLTVMHHIHLTHHYGGQGRGANQMVFISFP